MAKNEANVKARVKFNPMACEIIVPFDGTDSGWKMWSQWFYASMMVFGGILEGTEIVPGIKPDAGDLDGLAEYKTFEKNNALVYASLSLACTEVKLADEIVDNAVSVRHPGGDARLAWKDLVSKYEPKDKNKKEFKMVKQWCAGVDENEPGWTEVIWRKLIQYKYETVIKAQAQATEEKKAEEKKVLPENKRKLQEVDSEMNNPKNSEDENDSNREENKTNDLHEKK